jgi:hypothetical protein
MIRMGESPTVRLNTRGLRVRYRYMANWTGQVIFEDTHRAGVRWSGQPDQIWNEPKIYLDYFEKHHK